MLGGDRWSRCSGVSRSTLPTTVRLEPAARVRRKFDRGWRPTYHWTGAAGPGRDRTEARGRSTSIDFYSRYPTTATTEWSPADKRTMDGAAARKHRVRRTASHHGHGRARSLALYSESSPIRLTTRRRRSARRSSDDWYPPAAPRSGTTRYPKSPSYERSCR